MVDSESIHSGKVPVQSIHPRPTTPSTRDLYLKLGIASNGEREKKRERERFGDLILAIVCAGEGKLYATAIK